MTYKFEVNGQNYEIPLLKDAPIGALRKSRKADNEMDAAFTVLEAVVGVDSPELAAIDSLTAEQFGEWIKGWAQGASLGEQSSSGN